MNMRQKLEKLREEHRGELATVYALLEAATEQVEEIITAHLQTVHMCEVFCMSASTMIYLYVYIHVYVSM